MSWSRELFGGVYVCMSIFNGNCRGLLIPSLAFSAPPAQYFQLTYPASMIYNFNCDCGVNLDMTNQGGRGVSTLSQWTKEVVDNGTV